MKTQGEDGRLPDKKGGFRGNHSADSLISAFSLQNCEEINFHCLNHPVCGALLWQAEQRQVLPLVGMKHVPTLASGQLWLLHLRRLNFVLNLYPGLSSRRYLAFRIQDTLQEQATLDKHRKPKPHFLKEGKEKR